MAKVKLTKTELKKQKDSLRMYERYLPTLRLKKRQLQVEIRAIEARRQEVAEAKAGLDAGFRAWIGVFGQVADAYGADGLPLLSVASIRTGRGTVAGVDIPLFQGADFDLAAYDLFAAPLWVDFALERVKAALLLDLELEVLEVQVERLGQELRITSQRVNLFEKVKIPGTVENIRRIRIYLGDQQTAQVVRGKIAKRKLDASRLPAGAATSGGGET